jgi:hypothetical protein
MSVATGPGRHGIHTHADRRAFERCALGQTLDGVLAGRVDRGAGNANLTGHGRKVDDGPATLAQHHAHFVLERQQRAEHVGVERGRVIVG